MDPRRILVIQLRRIGDVLLTMPAVAALKARFPQATIDFLVEKPSVCAVQGRPEIGDVILYESGGLWSDFQWILRLREQEYDLVVDFMGNPRTAILTAFSGAPRRAGPAHVFHRWAYNERLPQSTDATYYASREKLRMLAPLGVPDRESVVPTWPTKPAAKPENIVGLMPASRKITRRWPAASYAALGRMLRDRLGVKLLVFWGPGEKELAQEVAREIGAGAELMPQTKDLPQLAEQIARCRLVVTNCAGPKHVAVALDVPTLTIHGSSDPKAWTPNSPRHAFIRREELHCIGCMSNECRYKLECMTGLAPEMVFAKAEAMLATVAAA